MPTKSKTASKKSSAKAETKPVKAEARLSIHTTAVDVSRGGKLPAGTVKLSGDRGLVINVQKLSKGLIRDQRARMVSSMGCISNPGGPGC
jgi:hypothetical protein